VKSLAFSLLFLISVPPLCAQECLTHSKELFSEREFSGAEDSLKICLKQNPDSGEVLISLAGMQMVLGKFLEAENNFKAAMRAMGPSSPYAAYINSLLGDIAMRKNNLRDAAFFYDAALRAEPANINALVGKGITEEKNGRILKAAAYFRRALAVDFTNMSARERLIAMEPDILTKEEVIASMKERNIIDPAAVDYLPEENNLFKKILALEKDNAIEYLALKYNQRIPVGFIVERDGGKVYVRKMLTLTGYQEIINQLSIDAKNFFLAKNILPGNLFKLKDFDGKPVFDDKGVLTDAGMEVYNKGLSGLKAYVEPGETLPSTQREIDALVAMYQRKGYSEITEAEFLYLMNRSRCNENTLVKDFLVKVINISSSKKRVFVLSAPNTRDPYLLPYSYVIDLRMSYNESKKNNTAPVYSSAFGLGGGADLKPCKEDGTLASAADLAEIAQKARRNQKK
jgi:tetratricopeptide (TPR) repeat protein